MLIVHCIDLLICDQYKMTSPSISHAHLICQQLLYSYRPSVWVASNITDTFFNGKFKVCKSNTGLLKPAGCCTGCNKSMQTAYAIKNKSNPSLDIITFIHTESVTYSYKWNTYCPFSTEGINGTNECNLLISLYSYCHLFCWYHKIVTIKTQQNTM